MITILPADPAEKENQMQFGPGRASAAGPACAHGEAPFPAARRTDLKKIARRG